MCLRMQWLATRSIVFSIPRSRILSHLHPRAHLSSLSPRDSEVICHLKRRVISRGAGNASRRSSEWKCLTLGGVIASRSSQKVFSRKKASSSLPQKANVEDILWWQERMQLCKKPTSCHLVKRLVYSNLLGLDDNLRNGSLKEGTLNWELLQFKLKFPREVLLCRVGEFYEAIGIDACMLVEHAGLNPFGGLRSDSVPRAGCPIVNLRQTLDDLTRNGYSVCIVEEVQGPTQGRTRKGRFVSGHAHPGSPYVFGLAGVDLDLEFPEPMPVVGICRSAKGHCLVSILETMKTFSAEEGLTEEALVSKLRTIRYHYLFLHSSVRQNASGTSQWREYGPGGLLWAECQGKQFEWFEGDPVLYLLAKVRELYGLDPHASFRNVTISSDERPRPLYVGTAAQIGALPTEGIPCLLNVLLPPSCHGLPQLYLRDLLLHPPAYEIASAIQEACKLVSNVKCSVPDFTCASASKFVKLLEAKEANRIEFLRIKSVVDDILQISLNDDLNQILRILADPTRLATGLTIDCHTLVEECMLISRRISELIFLEGEPDHAISSFNSIPDDFFLDMESSWKGRVKRIHAEKAYAEVEKAAEALHLAVEEDFLPIVSRVKAMLSTHSIPRGEISYSKEHGAIWFKGKRFVPGVWSKSPGEEQIKQLIPAIDSKGRKVGEEWFTTPKVEEALSRYHEAGVKAKLAVTGILMDLSTELQDKINVLIFSSTFLVIAKALFSHVSEGLRRKWTFPSLFKFNDKKEEPSYAGNELEFVGLSPYWFDIAKGDPIQNTIKMQSLFLLTGPNGGGKSCILRSICAATLLAMCGLMVPAESASVPHFDSIMLHMKHYDSPADGKSSFQMEMSELHSILSAASARSLVLIDEICRGTDINKGTCIAGSIVETLDEIGCFGVVSTHLHQLFDLPLTTKYTVCKAMGTDTVNGETKPTWKLVDGVCQESLAFETARNEGIPDKIVSRAEELYFMTFIGQDDSSKEIKLCNTARANGYLSTPGSSGTHAATCISSASLTSKVTVRGYQHGSECMSQINHKAIKEENCFLIPGPGLGVLADSVQGVDPTSEGFYASVERQRLIERAEFAMCSICQKKLIQLYNQKDLSSLIEVNCAFVGPKELPPPSTIGFSSVYAVIRPDGRLYIGQTDDLAGRIRAHRSKAGAQCVFLYVLVPGKSLASQLETFLINQLPTKGFSLTNKADGKHRNFSATKFTAESSASLSEVTVN